MGMYTEFYFRARIKDCDVAEWLYQQIHLGGWFDTEYTFAHRFFTLPRWQSVFIGGAAVYQESRKPIFRKKNVYTKTNELVLASSLKNYSQEIESFIDWITPELDEHYGTFLGYSLYEDSCDDSDEYREHPKLFFYGREPVQ